MLKTKIRVGGYYELLVDNKKVMFAVLYGFESGKNKDVYATRVYTKNKDFEFPMRKELFKRWVDEKRVKEISSEELLNYVLKNREKEVEV